MENVKIIIEVSRGSVTAVYGNQEAEIKIIDHDDLESIIEDRVEEEIKDRLKAGELKQLY